MVLVEKAGWDIIGSLLKLRKKFFLKKSQKTNKQINLMINNYIQPFCWRKKESQIIVN